MTKWKSRSCPRCTGDLYNDSDYHGIYEQCLQCGYRREIKNVMVVGAQNLEDSKKAEEVSC